MERAAVQRSLLERAERDRQGVQVSHAEGVDFGTLPLIQAKAGQHIDVVVNTPSTISLLGVKAYAVNAGTASR